jgi:hypothetical protein
MEIATLDGTMQMSFSGEYGDIVDIEPRSPPTGPAGAGLDWGFFSSARS